MIRRIRKRKCRNCHAFFPPEPRNAWHQKFCSKPGCRKASKATSHSRWLANPENKDYFKGPHHVRRAQEWRKTNPKKKKQKRPAKKNALQDVLNGKPLKKQGVRSPLTSSVLQDILNSQPLVFIGLIAQLTGSALQDDIAMTASRLRQLGNDILNFKGEGHGSKAPHIPQQGPESPQTVQLGGSPPGP